MNWWTKARGWAAGGWAALALAAAGQEPPAENLRLPLEFYDDGRIKTQLTAGSARLAAQGPVEATDVRVELYGTNGVVERTITAARCRFDREQGVGASDSEVRLESQGLTVTGTGFEWNAKTRTVKILANVKVVMQRNLKWPSPGRRAEAGEGGSR